MDRLWSPWRSQHITQTTEPVTSDGDGTSVFARMAADDRDAENLILWRGQQVFVVMNLYPYNNGHLMVVPYRQVGDYEALTAAEQAEVAHTLARCLRWLKAALRPDGFNVGMNLGEAGGAGIPDHVHLHVVPRWGGDTNFMPTLAETKVIPEALRETYQKILSVIRADDAADG